MHIKPQQGFTLIELMIVISIAGILASVAIPQYNQYTRKAYYIETKLAATAIKSKVEICFAQNGGPGAGGACLTSSGSPAVRGQVTTVDLLRAANAQGVSSITLSGALQPIITAVPRPSRGITAGDRYVLTGVLSSNGEAISSWVESGPGCSNGYC